jgi:hypothetical protein
MFDVSGTQLRAVTGVVAAGCLLAAGAGCGDDSSGSAAKSTPRAPAKVVPARLLLRDGEAGFRVTDEPLTNRDAESLAQSPTAAARLRRNGFVSDTYQATSGHGMAGANAVTVFRTAPGARLWTEYESSDRGIHDVIRDPGRIRRFSVPGVPGARGWTGLDRHGNKIGQVYWVAGRCEFSLASEGSGPFAGPLRAGARAIYGRTKGMCPA